MTLPASRRTVLLATGAAALAVGCGNDDGGDSAGSSPSAKASGELTRTSDVPVGGGTIFKDEKVVVTQPAKGEFKAFSALCTHQGCLVGSVTDGVIHCPCHGSGFRITDGSVTNGPATRPLPAEQITVEGGTIRLV